MKSGREEPYENLGLRRDGTVFDSEVRAKMIGEFDTMPAIPLVFHPHRFAGIIFWRIEAELGQRLVFVTFLVPRCRDEIVVNRLVRQIQHEGFIRLQRLKPVHCVIGQLVGNITFLRHMFAIHVQAIFIGPIGALLLKTDPMVKPGLRIVTLSAHMPFADESGLITCLL